MGFSLDYSIILDMIILYEICFAIVCTTKWMLCMPIDIAWKHKLLVAVLGSGGEGGSLLVIKCIACEHGMMIVNTIGGGMWHDNYEHNILMVSMIVW
jgi:hypothetical protein